MHIKAEPITPNQNPPRIFTSWDILSKSLRTNLIRLSTPLGEISVAPWSFVKCGGITRVTSSLPWILVPRMCLHWELGPGVHEVWNGWMYKNYLQITLWIHFQTYEQVILGNWNSYLSLADDQLVTRANLGCFVLFKLSLDNRQFLCSQWLRAWHRFQTESTS